MQDHPQFESLCAAFLERHGIASNSSEMARSGFSFKTDDLVARVNPPASHGDSFELVIEIMGSDTDPLPPIDPDEPSQVAPGLLLLARLNYLSRGEHAWVGGVDDTLTLVLMRRLMLSDTRPDDLDAALTEGLERGRELLHLWQQYDSASHSSEPRSNPGDPMHIPTAFSRA